MLRNHSGVDTLEWIVVGAIVLAVVGTALWALSQALANRLQAMSADLGAGGAP